MVAVLLLVLVLKDVAGLGLRESRVNSLVGLTLQTDEWMPPHSVPVDTAQRCGHTTRRIYRRPLDEWWPELST
jgi:hypothetical protein